MKKRAPKPNKTLKTFNVHFRQVNYTYVTVKAVDE